MDDEELRLAVYEGLAAHGRVPDGPALASATNASLDEVRAGLERLAARRHVVLGSDGSLVMAHPFSAVPLGFSVMGRSTLWWGGCAWDSFALPHLLEDEPSVLVATTCPACDRALAWTVRRSEPPEGDEVAHFLVPVSAMWSDVVHTCRHQRLFCSERCVGDWLDRTGHTRGALLNLRMLWRLASHWYDGRMSRGYVRREPEDAREYFRSVGLSGPFWGLG